MMASGLIVRNVGAESSENVPENMLEERVVSVEKQQTVGVGYLGIAVVDVDIANFRGL